MKFKIIPNEQTPYIKGTKTAEELIKTDKKLLEKFLSFAMRQHNCTGLASNQVAVNGKRIEERFFAIKDINGWELCLMPEIIEVQGNQIEMKEGCLTWLGKTLIAKRFINIVVTYYDLHGKFYTKELDGFKAQVFQHEYDHLNGIEEIIK